MNIKLICILVSVLKDGDEVRREIFPLMVRWHVPVLFKSVSWSSKKYLFEPDGKIWALVNATL